MFFNLAMWATDYPGWHVATWASWILTLSSSYFYSQQQSYFIVWSSWWINNGVYGKLHYYQEYVQHWKQSQVIYFWAKQCFSCALELDNMKTDIANRWANNELLHACRIWESVSHTENESHTYFSFTLTFTALVIYTRLVVNVFRKLIMHHLVVQS
jgi:hypothetical protein